MPYATGLQAAAKAFLSAGVGTQIAIAILALVIILLALPSGQEDKDDAPVTLPGCPMFAIYPFFRHRFDFLNRGFLETGQSVFQFSLLRVCLDFVRKIRWLLKSPTFRRQL